MPTDSPPTAPDAAYNAGMSDKTLPSDYNDRPVPSDDDDRTWFDVLVDIHSGPDYPGAGNSDTSYKAEAELYDFPHVPHPIRHAHRINEQLNNAGTAARRIINALIDRIDAGEQPPIEWPKILASDIIELCSDACQLELHAATCDKAESPTATLATTITVRKIARRAYTIIEIAQDANPNDAAAVSAILTTDIDIPQALTDACEAIIPGFSITPPSDNPIRYARRVTRQLIKASIAADRIGNTISEHEPGEPPPIDFPTFTACCIIDLCSSASRLEIHAATCNPDESPTTTLAATLKIQEIARWSHNIIEYTSPNEAGEVGKILTPDTNIPRDLKDACDAIALGWRYC